MPDIKTYINIIISFILICMTIQTIFIVHVLLIAFAGHVVIRKLAQNLVSLSEEDLIGALRGVIRIQHIYGLKTQDLADGNILGHYRRPMTAMECKEMMVVAFYSDLINIALDWLEAAIHRIESGDESVTLTNLLCKAAAVAYDVRFFREDFHSPN